MEAEVSREPESVWQARVLAWRSSGLSRRDFCAEEGLSPKTFGWWVWRLSRPESEVGRFVSVTVAAAEPVGTIADAAASDGEAPEPAPVGRCESAMILDGIEIALPDGLVVRVGAGFDAAALRRVLGVLGR